MSFDVDLEIHSPGLNLHHERWNYHVMFMDEVHRHARDLAAFARASYERLGRGSIYIGQEQWMAIIEGGWQELTKSFPCEYLTSDQPWPDSPQKRLGDGHRQMIETYDPATQLVLTVLHHPGELLSAYLLRVE